MDAEASERAAPAQGRLTVMKWLGLLLDALGRRRALGMSAVEFGRLATDEPEVAAELMRGVGDVLNATGRRLIQKGEDLPSRRWRRARRLERRGHQRIALAEHAWAHAHDLRLTAQGLESHCSASPTRKPLT